MKPEFDEQEYDLFNSLRCVTLLLTTLIGKKASVPTRALRTKIRVETVNKITPTRANGANATNAQFLLRKALHKYIVIGW